MGGILAVALMSGAFGSGCSSCPVTPERPPLDMLTVIADQGIEAFLADLERVYAEQGQSVAQVQPLVVIAGTRATGDVPVGSAKENLDLAISKKFQDAGVQVLSPDLTDQILLRLNMQPEDLALASEFERFKAELRGAQAEAQYYLACRSKLTGVCDRNASGEIQTTTVSVALRLSDPNSLKQISQDQGGAVVQRCGGDWVLQ